MRQDAGVDGDAQRISQLCWMFFLKIVDDQDQELELFDKAYRSPIPKRLSLAGLGSRSGRDHRRHAPRLRQFDLFPALKNLEIGGAEGHARARGARGVRGRLQLHEVGTVDAPGHQQDQEIDFNDLADRQHFGDIYEQILNDLQSAGNAGEYYTPRAVTAFMADRIDPRPGEILLDPACGTGGFLTCAMRHMRDRYVRKSRRRGADAGRLASGREEAAPAHAVRHQHAAAQHRGPELRPPRQHARATLRRLWTSRTGSTSC